MIITEIKDIHNHRLAYDILKAGKLKFDCDIVVIHLSSGFYWTNPIITEGSSRDDVLELLDGVYWSYSNKDMPFTLYTYEDVIECIGVAGYKNYLYEEFTPLNGGEYYTTNIVGIEDLEGLEWI